MTNILITIIAYFIDRFFGEFKRFRHPVCYIKDMINFYEERYYKDSIVNGLGLVIFMVFSIGGIALIIEEFLSYFIPILTVSLSAIIASMFISYKTLHESVHAVILNENKHVHITDIVVNQTTQKVSESNVYKTTIEYYAKNLISKVIAPIFYLLLFGLPGILVYTSIRTMDSMVGNKTQKYKLFGKSAALLDDVVNYIPSRITAVLIMLFASKQDLFEFYEDGKKHESPNTGHPIAAMALALDLKLGSKDIYFGNGRKKINAEDVSRALQLLPR